MTDELVALYRKLGENELGLIVSGYMSVHPLGRAQPYQVGIESDALIPGLRRLADAVHQGGAKIFFQLAHAGRQTYPDLIGGQTPLAPSAGGRDPLFAVKPREMSEQQIQEVIAAYAAAARRAYDAGADGIHIGAGGGYLINQFLSPFFNKRQDPWGGSADNMFRLFEAIITQVKSSLPQDFPLLVKINLDDHTPKPGITPELAHDHAARLARLGISALEVSAGTVAYSNMHMWLGEVAVKETVAAFPFWKRPFVKIVLRKDVGKYDLKEGWNREALRALRPLVGDLPLMLVGGLRRLEHLEEIVGSGDAQLVAMCRPFIREPLLIKKLRAGEAPACVSCNRCVAAVLHRVPTRCYVNGLPARQ